MQPSLSLHPPQLLLAGEVEVGRELGNRSREAHVLAQDARAAANAAANNASNLAITNRFKVHPGAGLRPAGCLCNSRL